MQISSLIGTVKLIAFQGLKKYQFQGPALTMALVMDIARIKIITSGAIKITGTLIVITKQNDRVFLGIKGLN